MPSIPDVVHIGSASRDRTPEDPRGWRLGGGVTYASLTTARLGLATAAWIGLDPAAMHASELDLLRAAGVDVIAVPLAEGPVFDNIERPGGRVQFASRAGVRMPDVPPPSAWRRATAWSVVPVADELPHAIASWIPDGAFVAFGWQGLLRSLRSGARVRRRRPAAHPVLSRADLVGLSRTDVARDIPLRALTAHLRDGARLCVTDGADGGRVLEVLDGEAAVTHRFTAVRAPRIVDETGAGDVFLAALSAVVLGRAARPTGLTGPSWPTPDDLRFAAGAAALAVGDPGVLGIPVDRAAVRRVAGLLEPPDDD